MTKESDSSVLIDLEFFESRRQVGEDFLEKLVEVFSLEAPKLIGKIKSEAKAGKPSDLADLGHKLKGMCLNVGAEQLSTMGKQIETFVKDPQEEGIDHLISELDSVLERTLSKMKMLVS